MSEHIIIVAGGSGLRMGSDIPKQFLIVNNKPILQHTLERVAAMQPNAQIILAIPPSHFEYWRELARNYECKVMHRLVAGGETRYHTVKNALDSIDTQEGWVAIHDGVRPLVSLPTWQACINAAKEYRAAIPVTSLTESLRKVTDTTNEALDRSEYRLVQTPQTFDLELIKEAYEQAFSDRFTDDASVVEQLGYKVHLVDGNTENIKITRPIDLKLAEWLLQQ